MILKSLTNYLIGNAMIFKKLYKIGTNGKLELFGIDGLNHMAISIIVMVIVIGIVLLLFNLFWAKVATVITLVVLTIVWYLIEHFQEVKMIERYPSRPKHPWNFLKWSRARTVADMGYPLFANLMITWHMLAVV